MAKTMTKKPYILATGRRKKSIARVRILENGTGKVEINGVNIDEYFKDLNKKKHFQIKSVRLKNLYN